MQGSFLAKASGVFLLNYTTNFSVCQIAFGDLLGEKSFPHPFATMCKTVENSVDYAEKSYFDAIIRLFSYIYA